MESENNNLHERLLFLENEVRNLKMGTSGNDQKPKKEKKEKKPRAQTEYNKFFFCSGVKKDNIFGTQFHPEKSGKNGINFLKNLLNES